LFLAFLCCLTVVILQAGKFLVRSENISGAVWRQITNEIRRDADYLFKIIGKAYSMLSDPTIVSITEA
jgi:DnaJ family protein C protein 7